MENKKTEYNIWPLLLFKNCECGATGCNKKVPKEDNLKLQMTCLRICAKSQRHNLGNCVPYFILVLYIDGLILQWQT
jgi:hypothetical protein